MLFVDSSDPVQARWFSDEVFLQANLKFVERFAYWRLRGYPREESFQRTFSGELRAANHEWEMQEAARRMEYSGLYQRIYSRLLRDTPIDELWNCRECLDVLLGIVHTPLSKSNTGATRLRAARQLDDLTGARGAANSVIEKAMGGKK